MSETARYARLLDGVAAKLEQLPLHRLDGDPAALKNAFDLVSDAGLFVLHRYDPAAHEQIKFQLFSTLTPLSGTLAFLGIQILAANKILRHHAVPLRDTYFAKRCGIAVNHLRAPVTVVDAIRSNGAYRLSGRLTWASGYGIFDTLVAGFHCEGREMQAVVPFTPQPGFDVGETVETFVGNAMRTVDIVLDGYEVPKSRIVASHPLGTYNANKSVSKTIHYALYGLGRGAVSALGDDEVKRRTATELERIRTAFLSTSDGAVLDALRVELFGLLQRAVTTGMILHGGRSVLITERLQRYYRELVMFNANGLNASHKALFKSAFMH